MDLKSARLAQSLSLDELARRAGTTAGTLWRLERGGSTPSLRTRRLVADALGVEPSAIEWPGADVSIAAVRDRSQVFTK